MTARRLLRKKGRILETAPTVEIRPAADGDGFCLAYQDRKTWFGLEIHAINHARDLYPECDILLFDAAGKLKHRYTSAHRAAPEPPH